MWFWVMEAYMYLIRLVRSFLGHGIVFSAAMISLEI